MDANIVYALLLNKIKELGIEISNIPTPLVYQGNVESEDKLPTSPSIGHMYNIATKSSYGEAGMNVAWTGAKWDTMGAAIDMSLYYTKEDTDARYEPIITTVQLQTTDTSVNMDNNHFYLFPKMDSLNITLNNQMTGNYYFRFESGATATILTLPDYVHHDLSIEANRIYEVSICENYLAWTSWAV